MTYYWASRPRNQSSDFSQRDQCEIVQSEMKAALIWGGGGPRVVVSTAAFHARVRGSVPGLGGLKETKMFLPHPRVKVSIVGSLRNREVACSASDRHGSDFESCVWRIVSSQSSHHPQVPICAQRWPKARFISFHFISHLGSRSYFFTVGVILWTWRLE